MRASNTKNTHPGYLFVWEDVLTDYTPGMIVIHAPSLSDAVSRLDSELDYYNVQETGLFQGQMPEIIDLSKPCTSAKMWYVYGGG